MTVSLTSVLTKHREGAGTMLAGTSYPEIVAIVERMQAQDPRIIYDSLRPLGDEFWNMIDGQRTVSDIAEAICFQFNFDLDPESFLPFVKNMVKGQIVSCG